MSAQTRARHVVWALAVLCAAAAGPAGAQAPAPDAPPDPEGVGIFERLDEQVPLDLTFTDEKGQTVRLGASFKGGKPVVLTLVYYTCPNICNALLNGLTQTLSELEWSAGDQFRIVTVSIDPSESHELAQAKKRTYLSFYGRETTPDGWRFLVGEQENIKTLADAVGFGYRYEPRTGLFTHAASVMICTPDGRLSRYLNDVMFEPRTLELALTEASRGAIGSPVERLLLKWCYTYDPGAGKYVIAARKVMAIGGGLMVLVTLAGLGVLWRRELKARRHDTALAGPSP
ncbi:MAG: SCO family protein [Planctomycetota bacterium]|jgi:protein SCO1/2